MFGHALDTIQHINSDIDGACEEHLGRVVVSPVPRPLLGARKHFAFFAFNHIAVIINHISKPPGGGSYRDVQVHVLNKTKTPPS